MSFPVFNQARDSINKAYVALQNWNTNPADIPLPDVVDTKRSHLTNQQVAARYLKSIEGNTNIDINKIPKMISRDRILGEKRITGALPHTDETPTLTQRRQVRLNNCAEAGGGGHDLDPKAQPCPCPNRSDDETLLLPSSLFVFVLQPPLLLPKRPSVAIADYFVLCSEC